MKGRCSRSGAQLGISSHDALLAHVWRLVHTLPGRLAPSSAAFLLDYRRRLPADELGASALGNHHLHLDTPDVDVAEQSEGQLADVLRATNLASSVAVVRETVAWTHAKVADGVQLLPGSRESAANGPCATFFTTDWRFDAYALDFGAGEPFWVHGWLAFLGSTFPTANLLMLHDAPPCDGGVDVTLQLGEFTSAAEAAATWTTFHESLASLRATLSEQS